jgi:aspartokinase-like uncharacterized kinase
MNSQTRAPLVVKIGGSLFDLFPSLVPVLSGSGRDVLLVPGGGRFADAVRAAELDDDASHWMAVAAMEQIGWSLVSHGVPPVSRLRLPQGTEVFLPYCALRETDALPHSWDVTSDTVAAWVAHSLGCDLLILKSVDGLYAASRLLTRIEAPIPCSEVDAGFLPYVLRHGIRTTVINGRIEERVRAALAGIPVTGTVVHPHI